MKDLLTICTPTVGDSAARLDVFFSELRSFTRLPYHQIVCDDGTADDGARGRQRHTCVRHGVEWMENPGPVYGVSYNLNALLGRVKTDWAFLLEDGLRPSYGWLEAAHSFIDLIGSRNWQGFPVGMAGTSHLQDWMLRLAGVIPSVYSAADFYSQKDPSGLVNRDFYGPWNDGLLCWQRIAPGLCNALRQDLSGQPHEFALLRGVMFGEDAATAGKHPTEQQQLVQKFDHRNHWPSRRTAVPGWYPGAFMLINMQAWRDVGRFRDGCTFFEGHLGVRMGVAGYLSLVLEFPPWLHRPSQGFIASVHGKRPRDHRDTDTVFKQDFFGYDHMDAPNVLAGARVPLEAQRAVAEELSAIPISVVQEWEPCL
jgi:hypothetical protein